jgi:predicted phage terminase large subunit-like protein
MKTTNGSIDPRTQKKIEETKIERTKLYGSLLLFTKVFYKLRTGRDFKISKPTSREAHFISVCRQLTRVVRGELDLLVINIPPRYGKTELLIHFVAWCLAKFPDCNFLYTSYSHNLAAKQSATIRDILLLREFHDLFFVDLKHSSKAKFDFETTEQGSVYAAGFGGTITGRGAGIKGVDPKKRFGGAIIIDDAHKPDEATSDTIREGVIDWYYNTLLSRRNNGNKTPIIFIGQVVHEQDLANHLRVECEKDKSNRKYVLSLPALDIVGNALYPEMHTKEELLKMQLENPYVFAAQMQQKAQPAGGGLFKKDWFPILRHTPDILATFITCDTAETEKEYNDATVFSLWGIYKLKYGEFETDIYGLYWLDCVEIRVEPKDLYNEFMQFFYTCMRYKIKPSVTAIEKKSTGTTLGSQLQDLPGVEVLKIERSKSSGSKTDRFISMQSYVAKKQITLPQGAKHTQMCIDHCAKITANNTHRHDDIADTLYDAVNLALINKTIINLHVNDKSEGQNKIMQAMISKNNRLTRLKGDRAWEK